MAIPAGAVWEVRTAGTNFNGGFWNNRGGASTDYSQQDAAEVIWTNLSTDVAGTQVTDDNAGGFFTAAMAGNGFKIEGVWYEMVAYIDGDNCTIDRSAGSGLTSQGGRLGGAVDDPSRIAAVVVLYNTIHIKAGTYTIIGSFVTTTGTLAAPIRWIGYNVTRGDNPEPSSGNQPLIDAGTAFTVEYETYNQISYLDFLCANQYGVQLDQCAVAFKCKSYNTEAVLSAPSAFILQGDSASVISSEAIATNGIAIAAIFTGNQVLYCYAHDSDYGIDFSTANHYVGAFNIVEANASQSITGGADTNGGLLMFNTVDGSADTGIVLNTPSTTGFDIVLNNQITNNANYGISAPTGVLGNFIDFNNFYLNTSGDVNAGVTKGGHATANDPGYTNRVAGDFSGVDDANALGMELGVS